jgi:hypothetical protein
MRFIRFQPKLGHDVSHCQCSRIYPNLPKSAQRQNFEIPPKIEILVFLKKKIVCIEEALEYVSTV